MTEAQIEHEIWEEWANSPEAKARQKEEEAKHRAYMAEKEAYMERTKPPELFDASDDDFMVRTDIYPHILVQVNGLVREAWWNSRMAVYRYGRYDGDWISVERIRFWAPLPRPVDPPEGFYDP